MRFAAKASKCREWFDKKSLQTLQGCVSVLTENHAVEQVIENITWPLQRFYVNNVDNDCKSCLSENDLTLTKSSDYNKTVYILYGEGQ